MDERISSSCCGTCEFFDNRQSGQYCEINRFAGVLKGSGNANNVFELILQPRTSVCPRDCPFLVARCPTKSEGSRSSGIPLLDDNEAILEEKMWRRRGYQVIREDFSEDHVNYVSTILAPQIHQKFIPLMVCSYGRAPSLTISVLRSNSRGFFLIQMVSDVLFPNSTEEDVKNSPSRAIIMPDATVMVGIPQQATVCLEIKPKFGSILRCKTIRDRDHRRLKHNRSRYNLHQNLKIQRGSIQAKSQYEPLDLFSGNPQQVHRSLVALMENPQNNMSIFIGGERKHFEEIHGACKDACQMLFNFRPEDPRKAMDAIALLVSNILKQEDVLDNILEVQKKCRYDIQAVEQILENLLDSEKNSSPFARTITCMGHGFHFDEDPLDVLADYCESATAKDCSIMITMAKNEYLGMTNAIQSCKPCEHGCISTKLHGGVSSCRYRVTVVDLDRKSIGKIRAHAELDRDIVESNLLHCDI